jgi:hypothetical protein
VSRVNNKNGLDVMLDKTEVLMIVLFFAFTGLASLYGLIVNVLGDNKNKIDTVNEQTKRHIKSRSKRES